MNPRRLAPAVLPAIALAVVALMPAGASAQAQAASAAPAASAPPQAVPAAPATVAALPGASVAANMGCLNCHGATPRGEAPSFARLQERAAQGNRSREELAKHWIEEMHEKGGSGWAAIVGHRQTTQKTAQALGEWLATPASKPVN